MSTEKKPQSAETSSRLWGARADDWANIQEGTVMPVYKAVFDRLGLSTGATHLDAGCGSGMAAQIASERGAVVSGLDAAENLLAIARTRVPNGEFQRGEPEGMEAAALISAIKPLLPAPPPGTPGPFALSDEGALRDFASSADLSPVEVFDVASPWHYPDMATALRGLKSSGVSIRAIEHAGEAAVDLAYSEAMEPFRQIDGTFLIDVTFRCLIARA